MKKNIFFCHNCFTDIPLTVGWSELFSSEVKKTICIKCANQLQILHGKRCEFCSQPLEADENLCSKCLASKKKYLTKNISIYKYNDFLQEILEKVKKNKDAKLLKIFASPLKDTLYQFKKRISLKKLLPKIVIVPMPRSHAELVKHEFNVAELLSIYANFQISVALKKEQGYIVTTCLENAVVILVDDLYDDGQSLEKASKALKEDGKVTTVYSLTLA